MWSGLHRMMEYGVILFDGDVVCYSTSQIFTDLWVIWWWHISVFVMLTIFVETNQLFGAFDFKNCKISTRNYETVKIVDEKWTQKIPEIS